MLKIKNDNIYLTRGQSAMLGLKIWNENGEPFVLPFGTGKASLKAYAEYTESEGKHFYSFYNPVKNGIFKFEGSGIVNYTLATGEKGSVEVTETMTLDGIVTSLESTIQLESITFDAYSLEIRAGSDEAAVLVFSVYAGSSDSVVLQKILNLNSYITTNGVTDYSPGGWNKFTKTHIIEVTDYDEVYDTLVNSMNNGDIAIVKHEDKYYHLTNTKDGIDIGLYDFALSIPLDSSDTDELESRNYTYDVAVYKGVADKSLFETDVLSFEKGYWKKQLVIPHTFTIGDSQNA